MIELFKYSRPLAPSPSPYLGEAGFSLAQACSHHDTEAIGTSPAVQWLRLCPSTAVGTGVISGEGNKFPHAMPPKSLKKKKN